ncbi:hypothetical protein VTO73DRAFT_3122 [Trametes versicolor]
MRELPPEIWLRVFAFATHIPGALSHDDGQSFIAFARDKYGISAHRRHRQATDLMTTAVRVCKAWSSLTTQFLFQYLLVKSGDHAVEVAAALKRYGKDPSRQNSAGQWTVRLELALEGVHRWDEAHSAALAHIFACCPNMTVFSTAFSTADASLFQGRRFLRAMRDVGRRSNLKRLELKGDAALLEAILSPLASSVEALWLLPSRRSASHQVVNHTHFPLVHAFILFEGFGWGGPPPTWTMPALQTLCTDDDNLAAPTQRRLQAFFEAHGSQLQHLVAYRSAISCLNLCTNLAEWTLPCGIVVQAVLALPAGGPLTTTLRRLTLMDDMSMVYMLRLDHIAALNEWLGSDLFPALETIRFLLPLGRYNRRQRSRPHWEQAIELLQEHSKQRGVRLEASLGGDEHTAEIWTTFSVEHLLDPIELCPFKPSFSAH